MTGNIRHIRPAKAAIAAVLAFSSPSLIAQTVVPPAEPVVTVPQAAPAPTFAPAQPMVQPTPSVEERLDTAIAASAAEKAPPPVIEKKSSSKPVAKNATRPQSNAAPTTRAEAPVQRQTVPPPAAPVETAAPVESAPPVAPASATPAVTPAPERADTIDPALLWALGGGAVLLIGLTGAAIMRRRRQHEEVWMDEATPVAPVESAPAMPLMTPAPVVAPAAPAPVYGDEERTLEAMVAAPPSPENPFRTQAKRMTRARFLLAQQRKQAEVAAPPTTIAAESPMPERAATQPATQTVYRFGSDRRRDSAFKPRTR